MAESRKPMRDNRAIIESAAFRLFRETGYKLTSYTMIAEEAGVGRPLVQYYFPKKDDLAISFILRTMDSIRDLMHSAGKPSHLSQGSVAQLGQVYYTFLLSSEEMRRLALDLLTSRQVTSRVIEANATYTIPLLGDGGDEDSQLAVASIKATGGVYELIYRGLERGAILDPADLALQNVAAFMAFSSKVSYEDAARLLEPELLDKKIVDDMLPELVKAVFG